MPNIYTILLYTIINELFYECKMFTFESDGHCTWRFVIVFCTIWPFGQSMRPVGICQPRKTEQCICRRNCSFLTFLTRRRCRYRKVARVESTIARGMNCVCANTGIQRIKAETRDTSQRKLFLHARVRLWDSAQLKTVKLAAFKN